MQDREFRVSNVGSRVQGREFRVGSSGSRVRGLECRVEIWGSADLKQDSSVATLAVLVPKLWPHTAENPDIALELEHEVMQPLPLLNLA
jgi:hypothetical protein